MEHEEKMAVCGDAIATKKSCEAGDENPGVDFPKRGEDVPGKLPGEAPAPVKIPPRNVPPDGPRPPISPPTEPEPRRAPGSPNRRDPIGDPQIS